MRLDRVIVPFLFLLLSSSCEKESNENDKLNFELSSARKNGKQLLNIVLPDTSYLFKISEIEKLSVLENKDIDNHHCVLSELPIKATGQSGIFVNDTIILFHSGGNAIATSLLTGESSSFQPECTRYHPHCNVANYHHINGKHYVYLSEWDGEHRCFVEEIMYDKIQKKWRSKLVQVLSVSIEDNIRGFGNMDWILDAETETIYTQTYKDGSSTSATALVFMQFKLPSPSSEKTVVFTLDNVIRRIEKPMIIATQDKFIYKGKMYIASGVGDGLLDRLTIFDLNSFEEEVIALTYRNDEPEAMHIYKDNIIIFYWTRSFSIQYKPSLFIHFNNGLVFSYPQSLIRDLKYI